MRHDAKLGLALGMLVIGFAVAFCFPRRSERAPISESVVPPPISAVALELLPIRAYQPTANARQPSLPPNAEVTSPRQEIDTGMPKLTPVTIAGTPLPSSPVASIVIPMRGAEALPGRSESENVILDHSEQTRVSTEQNTADVPETYLVKPGDTLTGIATRILGSSTRYLELYELNQNVLSSPNDLKIGMQLQIPSLVPKQRAADNVVTSTKNSEANPRLHDDTTPATTSASDFKRPPPAPWIADRPQQRN